MKVLKFLSVITAISLGIAPVSAQTNRAGLQSFNNNNITANGEGAITGPIMNSMLGLIINSDGNQADGNTWTGTNLFIGNNIAPNADGAQITSQNSSLTAASIYQPFNLTARLFDGVRGVMNLQSGDLLGASGVGSYVYNTLPHSQPYTAGSFIVGHYYTINYVGTTNFTQIGASSNTVGVRFQATGVGAGTGVAISAQDNGVAFFGEIICGGNNAACWAINTAENDLDLLGVSHPALVLGYEMDVSCFNPGSICNALGIISNFQAQPLAGIALSIGAVGPEPNGFITDINLAAGTVAVGGDAIIIGAVQTGAYAASQGTGPSVSNDIAFGFQTSNKALGVAVATASDGGSGCTPTTYSVVGGTPAAHYTLAATVSTTATQISPAGQITAFTFGSGSGYTLPLPGTPVTTLPLVTLVTLTAAPTFTDTCATPPTANVTWYPAGDSVATFASSNGATYGNVYFQDSITSGSLVFSLAGGNETITAGAGQVGGSALPANLILTPNGSSANGFGSVEATQAFVAQVSLYTPVVIGDGTAPTITTGSCVPTQSTWTGGATVGRFVAVACSNGTYILTGMPPVTHGYNCIPQDQTTTADVLVATTTSINPTTSCILTGTTAANDLIHVTAIGW